MTVENTNNTISYTGNSSVTTFAYNFLTYSADHIFIYFDDVLQSSGFTITGVGDDNGGDVVFVSPPATGVTIRIDRTVPDTQLLEYQEYGPFPAKANERGLDLLTMAVQQNAREIARGSGNIEAKKMDKQPTADTNNIVIFDSEGNSKDSGKKLNEIGNGGSFVGENPPNNPEQGDRWTRCTDMKGFIWYVDADGGQWVEDRPSYGEDTIGDVSVPYIFDTVADYQASTTVFPIGKTIHLNDRGADFTVIAGTGTANGFNVIASNSTGQSVDYTPRDFVSVVACGAIPDGATDNWRAFYYSLRLAVDGGFGVVSYPSGVLLTSRAIRLDNFNYDNDTYYAGALSGVTHRGAGMESTTIKSIGYNNVFSSFPEPYMDNADVPTGTRGSDITIEAMTIDCDYDANPDYGTSTYSNVDKKYEVSKLGGTWGNGASTPAVATWAADNYQYPIYMNRNERVLIKDCLFKRSWYNGVEIYRSNNIRVKANIFLNVGDKPNVFGTYCAVEPDNSSQYIWITGNTIENCGSGIVSNGDPLPYATSPVSNVVVSDNQFINISSSGVFAFSWVQDWIITGNTFEGIGATPIYVFDDNRPLKEPNRHPDRFEITHNIINSYNINNVDTVGIRFNGISASILGNTVIQRRTTTTANTRAILVSDANIELGSFEQNQFLISNNICQGRFPTDTNSGVIQIMSEGATCTGNTISLLGSDANTPFIIFNDNSVMSGNTITGSYANKLPYNFVGCTGTLNDPLLMPLFDAATTATQTNLSDQYYTVAWDDWGTIVADNLSMYEEPNNQIAAAYSGYYRVNFTARFQNAGDTSSPKDILCGLEVGSNIVEATTQEAQGGSVTIQVSALIYMDAAQVIKARVYSSDTDWNLRSGTRMTFEYIGSFN